LLCASLNGIDSFALIHDSYGTVAGDVDMRIACLKKSFVQLYTEQDPLSQFRVDISMMIADEALPALPPVPEQGTWHRQLDWLWWRHGTQRPVTRRLMPERPRR
jgi:DNA-directed RNA polymerase